MKKYLLVITGICAAVWGYLGYASVTFGNPSIIPQHNSCRTALATSTVLALYPTGTTTRQSQTLYCDAYNPDPTLVDGYVMDSAILAIRHKASTTSSVLKFYFEASNGVDGINCVTAPTDCEWYGVATSTVASGYTYTDLTATSTYTLAGLGTNLLTGRMVQVQTPARYLRVVFTSPAASSTLWAELIPRKQVR